MNNTIIGIVILGIIVFCVILSTIKTEPLSLSQFPVPECSTCKSCKFYTCGKCGTVYQEQNKIGQTCDCGGFTVYRTLNHPSCYKQTLRGGPSSTEQFRLPHINKGSCASCDAGTHVCLEPGSTFDSGSTFMRNLPCPVPFPPIVPGMELLAQKQMRHVSVLDVYNHLQQGGLIIGSNSGKIADYAMKKLIEETEAAGTKGYPNFYYIDGPVLVMNKVANNYYWMIDYPIKYTPENFGDYVNTSTDWNIAKTAYHAGIKLLNPDAPIFFFSASPAVQFKLRATTFSCIPDGSPQSNTDFYYPGCSSKSCLWGPDYGDGNWLTRV